MKPGQALLLAAALLFGSVSAHATRPDSQLTPGVLCTEDNKDFVEYRYAEQIPYCKRNVPHEEKLKVAAAYGGIPQSEWPKYEFDHLIPLAAGGASDIGNIWPQPLAEAHEKDKVEEEVYEAMKNGTMTQAEAVQKIQDWILDH
ncbi:MAG: hypothetical protein HY074_19410 [Deltaproteobacteria bacterium]|nr:hypothetical protein [Deltaproteobacteria bacterium]